MIDVIEARKLIEAHCLPQSIASMELIDACGLVLAEPVLALIDTPPFDQSAMDGYALAFDRMGDGKSLNVSIEIQAGTYSATALTGIEVARIYTGAPLPPGTDTVVMQEKVVQNGSFISISDNQLVKGSNVRLKGSQNLKGERILDTGHLLTPAGVSFLASVGIEKVKVYKNPSVGVIVTGKELVSPGKTIAEGEIYESNSYGLNAALNQINIAVASTTVVDDNEQSIYEAVRNNLDKDILILTGGVSVGDYDFVVPALEEAGIEMVFHKVRQKPGKPFYFGKHDGTLVFALPGNPAAVMTCFYTYIVPAIEMITKRKYFNQLQLPLSTAYKKKAGLTYFLKGKMMDNEVTILDGQESYLMNSFAHANCIIEMEEEKEQFEKGELVTLMTII